MVLLLFYTCNGNGILETQKIRVVLPSRCWQLRVWPGRAGSLQDQWGAEMPITTLLRNGHATLWVPAPSSTASHLHISVSPELVRNAEPQTQPRTMILGDSAGDLSLPPPLAKRGPPTPDPLLAALQIHTPWADVCSEQGTFGMRAPWQRVRPLAPRVLGMGGEASRWLRIWLVLKDVPGPTQ